MILKYHVLPFFSILGNTMPAIIMQLWYYSPPAPVLREQYWKLGNSANISLVIHCNIEHDAEQNFKTILSAEQSNRVASKSSLLHVDIDDNIFCTLMIHCQVYLWKQCYSLLLICAIWAVSSDPAWLFWHWGCVGLSEKANSWGPAAVAADQQWRGLTVHFCLPIFFLRENNN